VLTKEQNELLTRTGPGTPCGELMRRYWQPVAVARDLDADPHAVRLLGEDLVLFRDGDGRPALLGRFCPHRGVDLSYGRLEDGGLRCVYHGWLLAPDGACLEQPGEPAGSTYRARVKHTAYPCREAGGLIFAYLGPPPTPTLPTLPFIAGPPERSWATRLFVECNYLQGNEGNVDPQHLSFLHRFFQPDRDRVSHALVQQDAAPAIEVEPTAWGYRIYAVRRLEGDEQYVRVTNFLMPNSSAFVGGPPVDPKVEPLPNGSYYKHHWHVPIDDEHHWKYEITVRVDGPVDGAYVARSYEAVDPWNPVLRRNLRNRYLQDREEQRTSTFTGIGRVFNDHDRMATETQGPIYDRAGEHLGVTDTAIIAMRRQLFAAIDDVGAGRDPLGVQHEGGADVFSELVALEDRLPAGVDFHSYWKAAVSS